MDAIETIPWGGQEWECIQQRQIIRTHIVTGIGIVRSTDDAYRHIRYIVYRTTTIGPSGRIASQHCERIL
jgi:hypothetical protein